METGWDDWQNVQETFQAIQQTFEAKVRQFEAQLVSKTPKSLVPSWPAWRNGLRTMVRYATASKYGRWYAAYTTLMILLSIAAMIAGTMQAVRVSPTARQAVFIVQTICAVTFTLDLIIDFVVIPPKSFKHEIGRFYFIIDLISVLPFWIALCIAVARREGITGVDTQTDFGWIMCVRVLRLFKLVELAGPDSKTQLLVEAISRSKLGFVALIITYPLLVIFWGTLVYYMEFTSSYVSADGIVYYTNGDVSSFQNIPISLWFMIVTISTTGYGDITPQTVQGRLFTSAAIVCGVFLIAFPLTIVNAQYSEVLKDWSNKNQAVKDARQAIEEARAGIVWISVTTNGNPTDKRIALCHEKVQLAMDAMEKYVHAEQLREAVLRRSEEGGKAFATDPVLLEMDELLQEPTPAEMEIVIRIKTAGAPPGTSQMLAGLISSNFPQLTYEIASK